MINVPPWSLVFEQPVHSWWSCVDRFREHGFASESISLGAGL